MFFSSLNVYFVKKKKSVSLGIRRYKTAHFKGYFLGARADLDIFFEFASVMESGRKNEGAILHLLMQFKFENSLHTQHEMLTQNDYLLHSPNQI